MKSIKQQYIDLQEGNMSQANFMRNLRMTMPHLVTNITSFDDSVKILRNKGILTEAASSSELAMGIKVEMEHTDDIQVAKKIAMDHLAENPNYYSDLKSSGVDTPQGLKSTSTVGGESTLEPNLNRANPRDGFSLGFFEENQEITNRSLLDPLKAAAAVAKMKPTLSSENEAFKVLSDLMDKANIPSREATSAVNDEDWAMKFITALKDEVAVAGYEEEKSGKYTTGGEQFPIREAKDEKTKWTNTSGKSMYDQFKEIDNLNGQEVLIGIDFEMEKNHELTKKEAAKIVIKNLKKNPIYYTAEDMSGVEGYEPEYIGGKSAQPEAHQMQPLDKNMGNVVDKKRGMQPVKGIEKPKKDSDSATAQKYKTSGISLMSLIAKTARGVKKMDATGEKMKKITVKEALVGGDFSSPNKMMMSVMKFIDDTPILNTISDDLITQKDGDGVILQYGYWDPLPNNALSALKMQFNVETIDMDDEETGPGIGYRLTTKVEPNLEKYGFSLNEKKLNKESLMQMIREELKEMFDGMEPMDRTGLDNI